jgi:hypothetical protein
MLTLRFSLRNTMTFFDFTHHRRTANLLASLLVPLAISAPSLAQTGTAALTPGKYVADGGAGHLTLKKGKSGNLDFEISTTGTNGHACSLEGQLKNGRAQLEGEDAKKPCIVTMKMTPEGISVEDASNGSCQIHCGMRASFELTYFQPTPACLSTAVGNTRKQFKQRYDGKQYAEARALLEPVLKDCARSLDWIEAGRIRNDLAVTLHKLGDMAACRSVLQPYVEDAAQTDTYLRGSYPPLEADLYLPVVRATRTNLKLCK